MIRSDRIEYYGTGIGLKNICGVGEGKKRRAFVAALLFKDDVTNHFSAACGEKNLDFFPPYLVLEIN